VIFALLAGGLVAYEASRIERAGAPYTWIGLAAGIGTGIILAANDKGGRFPVLTGAGVGYALGEAVRLVVTAAREDAANSA
jgi:hypothetical protein